MRALNGLCGLIEGLCGFADAMIARGRKAGADAVKTALDGARRGTKSLLEPRFSVQPFRLRSAFPGLASRRFDPNGIKSNSLKRYLKRTMGLHFMRSRSCNGDAKLILASVGKIEVGLPPRGTAGVDSGSDIGSAW